MTTLRMEGVTLPSAAFGPENPLPTFRGTNESFVLPVDPRIGDEERRYVGWKAQYRALPHRMLDTYDRVKKPRVFQAAILENEFLRATIFPELGGRLVSLFNKPQQRELLDRNPVFQPANLALCNAWFSGGVEWNTSCFGHYHLTCRPVFAARVTGLNGEPALRVYEWDRVKAFPWQVDFHLPSGSQFLFVTPRIVNTQPNEIAQYWWSNIAVPETPGTRVLVPADTAQQHSGQDPLELSVLPTIFGKDSMYTTNIPVAREFYFRIADENRKWIAALDQHGKGLVQASTARLQGRKLFCWGMNSGGRNWQSYLAAPGQAYIEIQAGLGKMQPTCIPMPAGAQWSWTEAYGMLETDAQKSHAPDWPSAWRYTESVLDKQLPQTRLDALHEEFSRVTPRKPDELLHKGSGWGALERRRVELCKLSDPVPPEFVFPPETIGAAEKPWLELLEKNQLPEPSGGEPDTGAFMTQDEWRFMLERALSNGRGNHWYSLYHVGVMRLEALDPEGAKQAWEQSLKARRTGWALRGLAMLALRDNKIEEHVALLKQAWEAGPQVTALALEVAAALKQAGKYDELRAYCAALPPAIKVHERVMIAEAFAAMKTGHFEEVEKLFSYPFATIREGEVTLTDIWFEYHANRLAKAEGKALSDAHRQRAKKECPPPANIDFRLLFEID